MGISALSVCAILAIVPLLWLPELPSPYTVWAMLAGGIVLAVWQNSRLRYAGMTLLFCAWCSAAKFFAPKRIKLCTAANERNTAIAHGAN